MRGELTRAWADVLKVFEWTHFYTLTFRDLVVHPEKGDKLFRVWMNMIYTGTYGKNWRRKKIIMKYARGLERQMRGTIHYHGLLYIPKLDREFAEKLWMDLAGFARVEVLRDETLACEYLSKYVAKGGEVDFMGLVVVK